MFRLWAGRSVMSWFATRICPASGSSKPAIIRSVVVLPEPLGPSRVRSAPPSTRKDRSLTTRVPPKAFERPRTSSEPPRMVRPPSPAISVSTGAAAPADPRAPQDIEFGDGGQAGDRHPIRHDQLEAGSRVHLVHRDAGMDRVQAKALARLLEVQYPERGDAVARPAPGETEATTGVGAAVVPPDGAHEVAAGDEHARGVLVHEKVEAPHVGGVGGGRDGAGAAQGEAPRIAAEADQVRVPERIDLERADEEHRVSPALLVHDDLVVVEIALRPPRAPPVGEELEVLHDRRVVEVRPGVSHHHAHARPMVEMREERARADHGEVGAHEDLLAVRDVARDEGRHQLLDRGGFHQYSARATRRRSPIASR